MQEQLMAILVPTLVTVIGTLVSTGLAMLTSYIKTKTKNEKLLMATDQLKEITMSVVNDLEQSIKKEITDGKLTKDEAKKIKNIAISRIRTQMPKAVEIAMKTGTNSLDQFISGKIEEAVKLNKAI